MAFIRLYQDSDFEACAQICIATLPPTLSASPEAAKLSPYLWTHPYTFLSPSTCYVLDDGTGTAVGYCIGCPDIHAFVASYPRYITSVLSHAVEAPDFSTREPWTIPTTGDINISTNTNDTTTPAAPTAQKINPKALSQNAYRADWMLLSSSTSITSRWRATMHIDLLPAWQGRSWGRQLIERFVASVQQSGQDYEEGEHIGVAGENRKVVAFYEKVGFRVVEDGEGGGGGGGESNIIMVRDIDRV
ncbi:hypothetical protein F5Y08DRAFT_319460 [Xylaria arbuscula]|nr:hypothetical protein F5Y08DRAFT_319460 [Xylaria arbuscula]